MRKKTLSPQEWRKGIGFSMATLARLLGIEGSNPSRTWQRYENGEREPPLALVCKVEEMSKGTVTTASWVQVRECFISRHETEGKP